MPHLRNVYYSPTLYGKNTSEATDINSNYSPLIRIKETVIEKDLRPGTEKRVMAKSEVQRCLDWLYEQKDSLEAEPMGTNKATVQDAISKQHTKQKYISEYRIDISRVIKQKDVTDEGQASITGAYDSLNLLSSKRSACLDILTQIASLEDVAGNAAAEFTTRAVHLANVAEQSNKKLMASGANDGLHKTSSKCLVAIRHNWRWVQQVMKCTDIHLKHAAEYQEFYEEAGQAEYWMSESLKNINKTFDISKQEGDRQDVEDMQNEMKEVLLQYLTWQSKLDKLFDQSKDIVPLPCRSKPLAAPRPGVALCNYRDEHIELLEGETVTVLDNTDRLLWTVKNDRGQENDVPSVILIMPSPYGNAVDVATKLRLQLLALWTGSVKRLGYQLINLLLLCFRDWDDSEVKMLQHVLPAKRDDLIKMAKGIEDTLSQTWSEYPAFQELQERILRMRLILEEADEDYDSDMISSVVVQVKMLEDLLNKYKVTEFLQLLIAYKPREDYFCKFTTGMTGSITEPVIVVDFFDYWETFKVILETLNQPKYMLVADRWDQLRYVTTAHFVKFWDTKLSLNEATEHDGALTISEVASEPLVRATENEVNLTTQEETTETDQITKSYEEERTTFVIKSVVDPRDGSSISLHKAQEAEIVDQAIGQYRNPHTGETMSFAEAMNMGKILVEFTSARKIKEEKSSIGLITIKTTKETRPYTIKRVIDPNTDRSIDLQEAIDNDIYDDENGTYRTESGEIVSLIDAIESGMIQVEYATANGEYNEKPETVSKTYAVHTVVDQRRRRKVPFSDAVKMGLLDRDTGAYYHNVDFKQYAVSEAIKRGFIKARYVADPRKLDIDPENKIVIERIENVRDKLLRSMRTVKAFQMAATKGSKK